MTNAVTGVVDSSYTKEKQTRTPGKTVTIWYVEVDGVTFSTGFKKLFEQGEHIDVTVKSNYGEWQYVKHGSDGLPPATGTGAVKKGNFGGQKGSNKGGGRNMGSFPIDPKDGQMSIIRQSSMDRAVHIVRDLVTAGLFKPASEEDYLKKLIEIALNITDYASGNDIMKLNQAKAAAKEAING